MATPFFTGSIVYTDNNLICEPVSHYTRTIAVFALLNVVFANASEYTETNKMPAQIHNLMKTAGYVFNQKLSCSSAPDTHSLRHYAVIERQRFRLFELTPKKKGWSFWNNSTITYVHRNTEPTTISFTHFEYDISYPFYF